MRRAIAFYDAILQPLGWRRQVEPQPDDPAGSVWRFRSARWPEFVVNSPFDDNPPPGGNGSQVSFLTTSRDLVHTAWKQALAAGARDEGAPGLRTRYAPDFFAAYFSDPDGHKICVVHTGSCAESLSAGE